MVVADPADAVRDRRLLAALQGLLGIREAELRPTLDQAATRIAEVLEADKVDVFLYQPEIDSLVALGTSDTPMGRRQRELGLDRMPLANACRVVQVYLTGEPFLTGRADEDPDQLKGIVDGLGVRSELYCALEVAGERRGVLSVVSATPDRFSAGDLRFLEAVAAWLGTVAHRAELAEGATRQAFDRGRRAEAEELARLTRREQEVAACIAEGLTNEEIAQRLVVTPATVASHVENILAKLGLRNRTQIGVWAVEHGLYRTDHGESDPA